MGSPVLGCQSLVEQIATVETRWQFGTVGVPHGPALWKVNVRCVAVRINRVNLVEFLEQMYTVFYYKFHRAIMVIIEIL